MRSAWSARTTGAVVVVVAGLALVALAAVLVPWDPIPGPTPPPADVSALLGPEQVARAQAYARPARLIAWTSLALGLLTSVLLAVPAVSGWLERRTRGPWWARALAVVVLVRLALLAVWLPLGLVSRARRVDAGLSAQSIGGWAGDLLRSEALGVAITGVVVLALMGLARRLPRAWPAAAAALAAAAVVLGSLAYPVVVEPLFNRFTPLADGPLRSQIMDLARAEGVDVDEVLVADASRRTTTLNAYVSGFGATRRVVLYDTLVESLPREEALSVVAHELAHARHDDVLVGTALGALGAAAATGLAGLLLGGSGRRRRSLRDVAVVPLLLAGYAVGSQLASPAVNAVSRAVETRADVDALEATGDPDAYIEMQRMLAVRSLTDPAAPAWSQWWWGSHPTFAQRVAVAESMRP